MTTLIKTKLKKSDNLHNFKYRVAANITEYHIVSKIIFLRFLSFIKMYVKMLKINMFKMDFRTFFYNCKVDTLSTFYPTVSGIIIPNLKSK